MGNKSFILASFPITIERLITVMFIAFFCIPANAQKPTKPILFTGATVHTGNGNVIKNAVFAIQDSIITLVADGGKVRIDPTQFDTIISLNGKDIYPGYIALNSTIGLREIDAVGATIDFNEIGNINPHVRSLTAFNTDSRLSETIRTNGIFTVQATPQAGTIPGSSSVFRLNGWNWQDAVRKVDDGMHLNWPASNLPRFPQDTSRVDKAREAQADLAILFEDAKAYAQVKSPRVKNLKLEAMRGLFSGKQTLFLHASRARDISDAVQFAVRYGIARLSIVGGEDSELVIDLLKRYNVSVVLGRIQTLPDRPDDPIERAYSTPKVLTDAGILVAVSNSNYGGMEAGTRNLGFIAGSSVAYGLTKEQALQLITLNAAKILGMEKTDGSLETGKRATFFVTSGDALDMRTGMVELAFIDGVALDLDNPQKALYRKYMHKYHLTPKQ